jgi:hypothetical protein
MQPLLYPREKARSCSCLLLSITDAKFGQWRIFLISDAFLIEKPPDRFLHLLRLRSQLVTLGDRSSNYDIIGAKQECFCGGDGRFLVVADGEIREGPDAGGDNEKLRAQGLGNLGASRPEEMTSSQPKASARRARDKTSASISQAKPRSRRSFLPRLVNTDTARTLVSC